MDRSRARGVYSPWAALLCTLAVLGLLSTTLFRAADAPPAAARHRSTALDGLRGFAAFAVFLHHALITHDYLALGVWRLPPSRFFAMAGQVGVAVFFLITGYLFWSKLVRERGRPHWLALYLGRVLRLGPVYTLAVAGMMLVVLVEARGALLEPVSRLLAEAARWLCLGILQGGAVDGDGSSGLYLAGVTWSLQYEWAFYAALPLLAFGARGRGSSLAVALTGFVAALAWRHWGGPVWLGPDDAIFAMLFAAGMACASLDALGLLLPPRSHIWSGLVVFALVLTFRLCPTAYAPLPVALLSAAFLCVVSGGDVFGLLRSRPARRLGNISFGVYMLQGLVLTCLFHLPAMRALLLGSKTAYWAMVLAAAAALVALATAAHVWLEQPGIRAGHQIARAFARRTRPAAPEN